MKQFILVINGPMCAGKSTVTKMLAQKDGIFRGSFDTVKWLIGNYSPKTPGYKNIAKQITFSTIQTAARAGLSVIVDGGFGEYRKSYQELARELGCSYIFVNIEAPLDVLRHRFEDRIEKAKHDRAKSISTVTLEDFHSRYHEYLNINKDPEAITLDSNNYSPEMIIDRIKETLTTI